jgi:hypothetical protein
MSRKILENMYSGRRESVNFKGGTGSNCTERKCRRQGEKGKKLKWELKKGKVK